MTILKHRIAELRAKAARPSLDYRVTPEILANERKVQLALQEIATRRRQELRIVGKK